jgi:hypothetical protein
MKIINSLVIGDNSNDLFGCHNDAILMYNLFYSFYLKKLNNIKWHLPNIFLNKIDFKIKNIQNNDNIIIYFSGHSNKYGELIINNKKYSCDYIIKQILENYLINNLYISNIIFIIDSCYGVKFITKNNYKNIKNISFYLSSDDIQKSKEFLIKYNENDYKYYSINEYNKIVNGIFTYYFHKIIILYNYYDIDNFYKINNHQIWEQIFKKFNQKIIYIKL